MNPLSGPSPSLVGRSPRDIARFVDQFADEVPGVSHAVVVSLDGLQLASSARLERDIADQIAALSAGLLSMANQCGELLRLGGTEYLTIRMPRGHVLFMRVGDSAGLAVAATADADLRVLAFQMTQFVKNIGEALTPRVRDDLHRYTMAPSHR